MAQQAQAEARTAQAAQLRAERALCMAEDSAVEHAAAAAERVVEAEQRCEEQCTELKTKHHDAVLPTYCTPIFHCSPLLLLLMMTVYAVHTCPLECGEAVNGGPWQIASS